MKLTLIAACLVLGVGSAMAADNPISQTELLSITKQSLDAYTAANPELANKVTGIKTSTIGQDAKVVIYVNHDGMQMQGNYTCIRQTDNSFACTGQ